MFFIVDIVSHIINKETDTKKNIIGFVVDARYIPIQNKSTLEVYTASYNISIQWK